MPVPGLKDLEPTDRLVVVFKKSAHQVEPVSAPLVFLEPRLGPYIGFRGLPDRALEIGEVSLELREVQAPEFNEAEGQVGRQQALKDQDSENVCILSFLVAYLARLQSAVFELLVCRLKAFECLPVVIRGEHRVEPGFHSVTNMLDLSAYQLLLLDLDILFLLSVV